MTFSAAPMHDLWNSRRVGMQGVLRCLPAWIGPGIDGVLQEVSDHRTLASEAIESQG